MIRPVQAKIPGKVAGRLPHYLRVVEQLVAEGEVIVVTSDELSAASGVSSSQLRRDLSYLGHLGVSGKGYELENVVAGLRRSMGLDRTWNIAMIGSNALGRGMIEHLRMWDREFHVAGLFDPNLLHLGRKVGHLVTEPLSELGVAVVERDISIGFVALADTRVQESVDALVEAGVSAIVNCGHVEATVPDGVQIHVLDPLMALRSMTRDLAPPLKSSRSASVA
ncbi:MAG: redox-sensing transcriptional repressor Rex [Chloroflexi bacterium]|nr:redox-sensing transcriptional repressor Rex [Chloroflexota bacterium]